MSDLILFICGVFSITDKVSLILLNWNGHDDTIECLESLKTIDYTNFDVYLVDNYSNKESIDIITNYLSNDTYYSYDIVNKIQLNDYVKQDDLKLLFILNNENAGFAGGNNLALEYIIENRNADYVLLLNNDTVVSNDFINGLIDKVGESNKYGFVGIRHYYYHNRSSLQTIGGGMVDMIHGESMAVSEDDNITEFDFITGSCILIPFDVLSSIGVMSTEFFMYWEDVDWSTTAREQGYNLVVSDYGCIYHKEGASIKSLSRIYYHTRNRILYMKRHTSGIHYFKFIIYIILFCMKESVSNIGSNSEYSKTLLKGLKDGLLKVLSL